MSDASPETPSLPGIPGVPDPGRPRRRWPWAAAAVAVIAVAALAIPWGGDDGKAATFRTAPAAVKDIAVTVTATGTLAPTNQVEVGSELSGIVASVAVDYNDRVKVGQVLATLDTSKLDTQALQAEAAVQAARARLLQAQTSAGETSRQYARLARAWEKSGRQIPSEQELDQARAAAERAEADEAAAKAAVSQAQATLETVRTDLGKAVIDSPINGIVLTRQVEPGQTVAAAFQAPVLFTLAEDLTQMELRVDVDEADVGQVAAGQSATFTVDAYPEETFPATVTQVRYGAQTVGGVVTYQTILAVDNKKLLLRPGMTATADIAVRTVAGALTVPNQALRFQPPATAVKKESSGGLTRMLFPHPPRQERNNGNGGAKRGKRIWVLEDGQPVAVAVTTGATDGAVTEIVKGDLKPGTPVIVGSGTP